MPENNLIQFFNNNTEDNRQQRTTLKVEINGCKIELDVYGKDAGEAHKIFESCLKTASSVPDKKI
ncbi:MULTISPECIES: hypothetical protein [unclassified Acinetobacter]|uniref:hypothetical protein n=1 Tax=unclassified Acinetobacter TaxID=196816 RepID=UPI00190CB07E|nr:MULTISPECIES: hypothetical protein [unclassified Acinetobacter]MBK0062419.1 hypothetical protein [Acinetobacter sp. S55]MBK0066223.1 hypothetical protein [Acinetobacter sp. S54]